MSERREEGRVPVEPPPTRWNIPAVEPDYDDIVAVGADLEPGTLLAAYRNGLFPMPIDRVFSRSPAIAWWSPDPRGVLPLGGLRVSRSLRQAAHRFHIRVDTAFDDVVAACADPARPGAWITDEIRTAYGRLHRLGWAHSVEAWTPDGRLAGGLYGVAIGGLFAGESMFHARQRWGRDASKVALVALVDMMRADGAAGRLLDVQWGTAHLASLGVVEISREEYVSRLRAALGVSLPPALTRPRS
ncbi:leucyl/phenylalanyl-tRNA--protein transferase [Phytoactinopolyspora alkaliphila]|uniref:Leucyl/phenylalanyl-tRNA--protein transferase n=1 Tax=Phytoactinopolyspora alkaliphila TaxID=1783498 RepID=A0A6N9YK42_9ACTN|nr:leucyl/phenylalanyl-tRNA--protein transferase [Phytoactinopolyspora alkaliphila]NED95307.1 leucyl/phenylalanyl-tRNA--protein transferase [Phytoactinopolyspora alkaliphila]